MRKTLLSALTMAMLLTACGRRAATTAADPETAGSAGFLPVLPPAELDSEAQAAFLKAHYWDRFDFADTLLLTRIDSARLFEAFVRYAALLSDADTTAMRNLMERASQSKPMLSRFYEMARPVLYDPNSPLRNDELLIPVLECVTESPLFDRYEKLGPAFDLRLARQNRIGKPANDFRYTLASGREGTLYELEADYVLLFINNPGCPMCKQIREAIGASPMLSEMIERNELKVLALYPDEDLTEWRNYRSEIPASWINGYDAGCRMREEGLYDLKAIPALYLLDRGKRVLVKDAVEVERIEWILDHRR